VLGRAAERTVGVSAGRETNDERDGTKARIGGASVPQGRADEATVKTGPEVRCLIHHIDDFQINLGGD
jgi:hypothetical protein